MERFRAGLLNVDRLQFEEIKALSMVVEAPGPDHWSGRFWLPAGDGVEPTRDFCLQSGDGRVGEMIMDRFALNESRQPPADLRI
jgi:hypothetical protein